MILCNLKYRHGQIDSFINFWAFETQFIQNLCPLLNSQFSLFPSSSHQQTWNDRNSCLIPVKMKYYSAYTKMWTHEYWHCPNSAFIIHSSIFVLCNRDLSLSVIYLPLKHVLLIAILKFYYCKVGEYNVNETTIMYNQMCTVCIEHQCKQCNAEGWYFHMVLY